MNALVRLYPAAWRDRYGDELDALMSDMSDGRRTSWRVRVDVAIGASRERARAAGLGATGTPEHRVRGGLLLVLWSWALVVLAGAVVQRTSEHWRDALPASGHGQAELGFDVLLGAAIFAALLVSTGIGLALPATIRFLRAGGWSAIRGGALRATTSTAVALVATAGLVAWASSIGAPARAGGDTAYAVAFVAWALVCAAALLSWTALAAAVARRIELPARTLRAEVGLAAAVSLAMVAILVGTAVWWAAVGDHASGFLGGSALPAQLILASVAMILATVLAATGTRHALRALPARTR